MLVRPRRGRDRYHELYSLSNSSAQTHSKDSRTTVPWARSPPAKVHRGLHKGRRNLPCTFCLSQCTSDHRASDAFTRGIEVPGAAILELATVRNERLCSNSGDACDSQREPVRCERPLQREGSRGAADRLLAPSASKTARCSSASGGEAYFALAIEWRLSHTLPPSPWRLL
jgi:hypothetical protein